MGRERRRRERKDERLGREGEEREREGKSNRARERPRILKSQVFVYCIWLKETEVNLSIFKIRKKFCFLLRQ